MLRRCHSLGPRPSVRTLFPRRRQSCHRTTVLCISGIPCLARPSLDCSPARSGSLCSVKCVGCRKVCLAASRPMGGRPCPLKSDDHRPATTRPRPYHDDDSCEGDQNLAHRDDDAYLTQSIPSGSPRSRWVGPSQTSTASPWLVALDAC